MEITQLIQEGLNAFAQDDHKRCARIAGSVLDSGHEAGFPQFWLLALASCLRIGDDLTAGRIEQAARDRSDFRASFRHFSHFAGILTGAVGDDGTALHSCDEPADRWRSHFYLGLRKLAHAELVPGLVLLQWGTLPEAVMTLESKLCRPILQTHGSRHVFHLDPAVSAEIRSCGIGDLGASPTYLLLYDWLDRATDRVKDLTTINPAEAVRVAEVCRAVMLSTTGRHPPLFPALMNRLGAAYQSAGRAESAIGAYDEALQVLEYHISRQHAHSALVKQNQDICRVKMCADHQVAGDGFRTQLSSEAMPFTVQANQALLAAGSAQSEEQVVEAIRLLSVVLGRLVHLPDRQKFDPQIFAMEICRLEWQRGDVPAARMALERCLALPQPKAVDRQAVRLIAEMMLCTLKGDLESALARRRSLDRFLAQAGSSQLLSPEEARRIQGIATAFAGMLGDYPMDKDAAPPLASYLGRARDGRERALAWGLRVPNPAGVDPGGPIKWSREVAEALQISAALLASDPSEAIVVLKACREMSRLVGGEMGLHVDTMLAQALLRTGRVRSAERLLKNLIQSFPRAEPLSPTILWALIQLRTLFLQTGRRTAAEAVFDSFERARDPSDIGQIRTARWVSSLDDGDDLPLSLEQIRDKQQVLKNHFEGLIQIEGASSHMAAALLVEMARLEWISVGVERSQYCLSLLDQASQTFLSSTWKDAYVDSELLASEILRRSGKPKEAIRRIEAIAEAAESYRRSLDINLSKANALADSDAAQSALRLILDSASALDEALVEALSVGTDLDRLRILERMSRHWHLGLAIGAAGGVDGEDRKRLYRLVTRRKGVVLEIQKLLSATAGTGGQETAAGLKARLAGVRTELASRDRHRLFGGKSDEVPEAPDLEARRQELEDELARTMPITSLREALGSEVAGFSPVPKAAVLLDFVKFRSTLGTGEPTWMYGVWTVRADDEDGPGYVHLGPAEEIEAAVLALITSCSLGGGRDLRHLQAAEASVGVGAPQGRVFNLLVTPIREALSRAEYAIIIPDGVLWNLPFEAIKSTEDGSDAFPNYVILQSRRDLEVGRSDEAKPGQPVVFGDPDFDRAVPRPDESQGIPSIAHSIETFESSTERARVGSLFAPLPGTRIEAELVASLLGVEAKLGDKATVAALTSVVNPRVLHIATHGFYHPADSAGEASDPFSRCGLAFSGANVDRERGSDGLISALEVLQVELRATELVVLSACETGLGELASGEGMFSLSRAFLAAGARQVISSRWRVSDMGAAVFFSRFYHELLSAGLNPQAALRSTREYLKTATTDKLREDFEHGLGTASRLEAGGVQRFLDVLDGRPRDSRPFNHPFFWAAFCHHSNGGIGR